MLCKCFFLLLMFCGLLTDLIKCQTLEVVTDNELLDLCRSENQVVALFTLKDCEKCKKYEETLTQIREELVDSLNAWVVKVEGSNLVHIYNPAKEPALVMFRHGVPLLIPESEAVNDEFLIDMLLNNRDPIVKELNDNSFEHLTQASTGATTGDWFIKFYSSDSIECQRLQARWETVGAKLKNRVNVARINRYIGGSITARRFSISQSPTFILLRRGVMYTYTSSDYTIESFLKFVEEDYKFTVKGQVPQPKSTFDDFVHMCFDVLRENPLAWKLGLTVLSVILLCLAALKKTSKSSEYKSKKKSTKTSSKKSKYFSQCKTHTTEFDECIKNAINNVRPYFTTGVPELGIPPFDPFFANEVKQSKGAGLLGYKLTIHNVTESGWRLSEIKKIKTNFNTNTIKLTHYFPEKYLEGYYEAENTILRPGVTTVGQFNLTLYDYIQTMTISKPKNTNQIKVSVQLEEIGNMSLHISNLLRGRVIVENVLDRLINASWRVGLPVVKPLINDLVASAFTKIWNDIFNDFDFSYLLP